MLTFCSRIAIPYDDSPLSKKALDKAIMLAKQDERIELNIITVVPVSIPVTFYVALNEDENRKAMIAAARRILNEVEQKVKELPNQSSTFVLEGNPAETIVEFAKKSDADLIVMGSRGLSGIKEFFLGSVSHYVAQKSSCPIFIVK